MDVRVGQWKKLSAKELMLLNCGVGEDSWESLGLKWVKPVHSKGNQSRIFTGRTDAEAKISILWPPDAKNWHIWKDPDAGIDWRQEEKGLREWDGWMASLTWRTWIWESSGSWWLTQSLVCCSPWGHRVRHNWATELNWTNIFYLSHFQVIT